MIKNIIAPTLLTAFYRVSVGNSAILSIQGHNEVAMCLEVIHANHDRPCSVIEMAGNQATEGLDVRDSDVLMIVARRNGMIVASGIYEIDTIMASIGYILVPHSESRILLNQQEMNDADRQYPGAQSSPRHIDDMVREALRDLDKYHRESEAQ